MSGGRIVISERVQTYIGAYTAAVLQEGHHVTWRIEHGGCLGAEIEGDDGRVIFQSGLLDLFGRVDIYNVAEHARESARKLMPMMRAPADADPNDIDEEWPPPWGL